MRKKKFWKGKMKRYIRKSRRKRKVQKLVNKGRKKKVREEKEIIAPKTLI